MQPMRPRHTQNTDKEIKIREFFSILNHYKYFLLAFNSIVILSICYFMSLSKNFYNGIATIEISPLMSVDEVFLQTYIKKQMLTYLSTKKEENDLVSIQKLEMKKVENTSQLIEVMLSTTNQKVTHFFLNKIIADFKQIHDKFITNKVSLIKLQIQKIDEEINYRHKFTNSLLQKGLGHLWPEKEDGVYNNTLNLEKEKLNLEDLISQKEQMNAKLIGDIKFLEINRPQHKILIFFLCFIFSFLISMIIVFNYEVYGPKKS